MRAKHYALASHGRFAGAPSPTTGPRSCEAPINNMLAGMVRNKLPAADLLTDRAHYVKLHTNRRSGGTTGRRATKRKLRATRHQAPTPHNEQKTQKQL